MGNIPNAAALQAFVLLASPALAWSECGHHIVALMAYDLLPEAELTRIRRVHPRYAEDFKPPGNAPNAIAGLGIAEMTAALRLRRPKVEVLGDDVYVTGHIERS